MYPPMNIPAHVEFTEPTPAMPEHVKIAGSSIKSYHNYYRESKKHLAKWSGKINSRQTPDWYY